MKHFSVIIILSLIFISCKKTKTEPTQPNSTANAFGWLGTDNPSMVPAFLNTFGNNSSNTATLPTSYDLSKYLPPIRTQNPYGTCVAWAVGYNCKSALEAISKNLSTSELSQANNQISPRDLFTAIPNSAKGGGCEGTSLAAACNILLTRGAATYDVAPYILPFDCSANNLQASWNTSAANHKIKYYRKVSQDVTSIKKCIANKIPVMFGGAIYSSFDNWVSGTVLTANSGTNRGLHAMTVIGYDNARGPNGAFKIVNSWGNGWGENGFIWIDYNFFVNNFVQSGNLYLMANADGSGSPTTPTNNVDLAPFVFSDISTAANTTQRSLNFNIYNIGSIAASPSANWVFQYIYYNAFNANDYGILFTDKFNTTVASNTYSCASSTNCSFNYSIPGGNNFANVVFGNSSITRTYSVPSNLNGTYYLVLVADATNTIDEQNEQNNLFYTTNNQNPKTFINGYSARPGVAVQLDNFINEKIPTREFLFKNEFNSAVNTTNPNAYSINEIMQLIKEKKASGDLDKKINEMANDKKIKTEIYKR